jgi:hypothetical protein
VEDRQLAASDFPAVADAALQRIQVGDTSIMLNSNPSNLLSRDWAQTHELYVLPLAML